MNHSLRLYRWVGSLWIVFFLILGVIQTPQSAYGAPVPSSSTQLSLSEAILYALQHSPKIDSALKAQDTRELEYRSALSKFLPSLDFSTSLGLQNNITLNGTLLTPNSSAPWYSSMSLGLTETLYDNGVSWTQKSIASRNQEVAALESLKSRANLTLDVATEFYNYSLSSALVDVKNQQLQILDKQFAMLSNQYQQGLKPRLDFLRFKTQVQRAQIDKTSAEKALEQSSAQLKKLLGVDLKQDTLLTFSPLPILPKLKISKTLPSQAPALSDFYDSKTAQLQKENSEANVTFAVRKYWPQLQLGGGVTYSNLNFANSPQSFGQTAQLSYTALITLQYNLWDWGIRRRDIQIAENHRDVQINDLNLGLMDVRFKIETLMIDISRVRETYILNQELLSSEEENYRNIEVQYREGKVNYLDLITSLNNLLGARTQFYSAYFEALQVLAKYYFYEGSIYEKLSKSSAL
jgi:outer membrane protein TolC